MDGAEEGGMPPILGLSHGETSSPPLHHPQNKEETKGLEEMRLRFPNVKDDGRLLRFLRARNLHIGKAVEMLDADLAWRKDFKPEEIRYNGPDVGVSLRNNSMYLLPRRDRENRPVIIGVAREHDPSVEGAVRASTFLMEEACRWSPHGQFTLLADLEGMAWKNVDYSYARAMVSILQNHYPERLFRFFIINTPWIFKLVWGVVRPWIDRRTVTKFVILGSEFEEGLQEIIHPENLPVQYGGTWDWRYTYPPDYVSSPDDS